MGALAGDVIPSFHAPDDQARRRRGPVQWWPLPVTSFRRDVTKTNSKNHDAASTVAGAPVERVGAPAPPSKVSPAVRRPQKGGRFCGSDPRRVFRTPVAFVSFIFQWFLLSSSFFLLPIFSTDGRHPATGAQTPTTQNNRSAPLPIFFSCSLGRYLIIRFSFSIFFILKNHFFFGGGVSFHGTPFLAAREAIDPHFRFRIEKTKTNKTKQRRIAADQERKRSHNLWVKIFSIRPTMALTSRPPLFRPEETVRPEPSERRHFIRNPFDGGNFDKKKR